MSARLSIDECRRLLGDAAEQLSDEGVLEIRDELYKLCEITLEDYIKEK